MVGYNIAEHTVAVRGVPSASVRDAEYPSLVVRPMVEDDVEACDALYARAVSFGMPEKHQAFSRKFDILERLHHKDCRPLCVFNADSHLVAFTTGLDMSGFTVSTQEDASKAIITHVARAAAEGQTVLLHVNGRQHPDMLRWCLVDARLKVLRQTTWMATKDVSVDSALWYFPSICG